MHEMKKQAVMMKEALLKGKLDEIGEILNFGWHFKKLMAAEISNPELDNIYDTALKNGALGGKISGAGGGGFMIFYCPGTTRYQVIDALKNFGGKVQPYAFTEKGIQTWTL